MPDLVLSDNLVEILSLREDAILMSSFLWHDILSYAYPDQSEIQSIVENQLNLLDRYRPTMICVKDMVMPEVLRKTNAFTVPWMCAGPFKQD